MESGGGDGRCRNNVRCRWITQQLRLSLKAKHKQSVLGRALELKILIINTNF
jgi:hypothetical protein